MSIVVFALTAFCLLFLVAAAAVPVARSVGVPLSVMLALMGLAYGLATSILGVGLEGIALDSYDMWFVDQLSTDAGTLLLVLLPPLLFEMALAVNVRRLLDDVPVVLTMAIVAVFAATLGVGLAVWQMSEVGFLACLLLGAAVATTDPGAVITTFREIGAPRRLLVILEGESLLNDAAAIAVFGLLLGALAGGGAPTLLDLTASFLWSFVAGAVIGVALAAVAGAVLRMLDGSAFAEASVTAALAYGAYLVSEQAVGASGVVAVVFAGLATGTVGPILMGPGNWPRVRMLWEQIGFWANAIILPLAASLVPGLMRDLGWQQAALVSVVYLGAFAARAAILFGLLPVLYRLKLSTPIQQRQKLLVLWGGVRGGVTLVLALSIAEIDALGEEARLLAGLAAGYAVLTLVLNASTLALATRLLGLDRLSEADRALRERIVAGSLDRVKSVVGQLARARHLEPEALAAVEEALGRQRAAVSEQTAPGGTAPHIPFAERLRVGLAILAGQETRLIRRAFEEGAIGPRATAALRLNADRIADATRIDGRAGWLAASLAAAGPSRWYRTAVWLHRHLGLDGPLRRAIEQHLTVQLETERVLRALIGFARETVAPMVGADAVENIATALERRIRAVDAEIEAVSAQYPVYAAELERILIARTAIRRERQQYARLFNDGVIGPELLNDLDADLDARERVAARPPKLDLTLSPGELIARVPFFQGLAPAQRRAVARLLRTRFTVPGETVLTAGLRGAEMYFIASGSLQQGEGAGAVLLGTGDFFGERGLLRPGSRRRTGVVSLGHCRLLVLRRRDYQREARRDPDIAARLAAAAEAEPDAATAPRAPS